MWDIFSFSFLADFWQTHGLWLMFFSAFLSATILPGNSEIVFVSLAAPKVLVGSLLSADIFWLVFLATAGNTLGSLTTYWIGRWFPKIDSKNDRTLWAINKIQRYGAISLLLSWLPIIGDVFCAVAGWLRLNWLSCLIFMTIGKGLRYIALLFFSLPFVS